MRMKKTVIWLDNYLEEFFMGISLILMTVIMGIQVFSRYVLGSAPSWSEEITRYLFVWSGFLSVSYCTKKCISIKIEQFVSIFPRRGKALFKLVNHTFELMVFLYLIPFAFKYMMSAVESGQVSPACHIPMYYVQAAPLASFILVAIRIIQRWFAELKVVREKMRKEKKHVGSSSIYLICNLSDHCHSGIDRAYDRIGPSGCF